MAMSGRGLNPNIHIEPTAILLSNSLLESYHWTNIGITVKWCIASDLVEYTCKEYVTLVPIKQS
jgi:hypothetical protein